MFETIPPLENTSALFSVSVVLTNYKWKHTNLRQKIQFIKTTCILLYTNHSLFLHVSTFPNYYRPAIKVYETRSYLLISYASSPVKLIAKK